VGPFDLRPERHVRLGERACGLRPLNPDLNTRGQPHREEIESAFAITEMKTIATPARVWFSSKRQVRCEIVECSGKRSLRASQWALKPDAWHQEPISVRSWGELLALIGALLRSWVSLPFRNVTEVR